MAGDHRKNMRKFLVQCGGTAHFLNLVKEFFKKRHKVALACKRRHRLHHNLVAPERLDVKTRLCKHLLHLRNESALSGRERHGLGKQKPLFNHTALAMLAHEFVIPQTFMRRMLIDDNERPFTIRAHQKSFIELSERAQGRFVGMRKQRSLW